MFEEKKNHAILYHTKIWLHFFFFKWSIQFRLKAAKKWNRARILPDPGSVLSQDMTDMDSVPSSSERSNSQRRASKKTDGGGQWQSTPRAPTSRVKVDVSKPSPSSEPQGEMRSSLPPPGTTAAVKPNGGQQHLGLLTSWGSTQFDFNRSTEGFFIMCVSDSFGH